VSDRNVTVGYLSFETCN